MSARPGGSGSGASFDTSVPHPARVYAYWLGGKDHYEADRKTAEEVIRLRPQVVTGARANRAFLARAVRYLATDCGIRQFLDIGTGLPAPDNTHQIAQHVDPACRVVYVDNDPLVLTHARALLTSTPQGVCDYLDADLHDPAAILAKAAAALDFTQPIGVLLGHLRRPPGVLVVLVRTDRPHHRPARRRQQDQQHPACHPSRPPMTSQPPTPSPGEVTMAAPARDLCISLQHYCESRPAHAALTFGELGTSYPRVAWPDCWHHTHPLCAVCWQTTSTSRSGPPSGSGHHHHPALQ